MTESWSGPPPYFVRITDKNNTKSRTIAGAAFPVQYGQYNIVLNPGVSIDWKDEVWVTLVPNPKVNGGRLDHATGEEQDPPKGSDREFPF